MPKIKLKSFPIQDFSVFDIVYDQIEYKIVDTIDELLAVDDYIPVINIYRLVKDLSKATEATALIDYLSANTSAKIILLGLFDGANVMTDYITLFGLNSFCDSKQVHLICSGNLDRDWSQLGLDCYVPLTGFLYNQIISANHFERIFNTVNKPYKFLFLNKARRDHREIMLKELGNAGLLNSALWTDVSRNIVLPEQYADYFNGQINSIKINETSHDMSYAASILNPPMYVDTYFSLITETNSDVPSRFFTEKIYKSILIGHPFIVVGCPSFYKFLHAEGYKTFDGFVDESFDNVDNLEERCKMISTEVIKLCSSDLDNFLQAVKPICEYNRLLFLEKLGKHQISTYYKLLDFLKNINA